MLIEDLFEPPRRLTLLERMRRLVNDLRAWRNPDSFRACELCDVPGWLVLCPPCEARVSIFSALPAAWTEAWERALKHLSEKDPVMGAHLAQLTPVACDEGFLDLAPKSPDFAFKSVDDVIAADVAARHALEAVRTPFLGVESHAPEPWWSNVWPYES
jgi:hypothetical protein